ncbi:MAG: hypothetical protein JXJ04_04835 [Spirochaetales bacterium]|nr:hypothetical protein [Spirochaetales bacterium]
MPIRINELTSDVHIEGSETAISRRDIEMIVRIVMQRIREEQERGERIQGERTITDRASDARFY